MFFFLQPKPYKGNRHFKTHTRSLLELQFLVSWRLWCVGEESCGHETIELENRGPVNDPCKRETSNILDVSPLSFGSYPPGTTTVSHLMFLNDPVLTRTTPTRLSTSLPRSRTGLPKTSRTGEWVTTRMSTSYLVPVRGIDVTPPQLYHDGQRNCWVVYPGSSRVRRQGLSSLVGR